MKKYLPLLVIVLIVAGGAYALLRQSEAENSTATNTTQATSKPSADASTAKFNDPCMLFSKTALESTLGVKFKDAEPEADNKTLSGANTKSCKFDQVNDGSVTALSDKIEFTVVIESYSSAEAAQNELNTVRSTAKLGDRVMFVEYPVAGVADEAFFFQGQAPVVLKSEEFMYARKGSQVFHLIVVKLNGVDHDQMRAKITDLAKSKLN